MADPKTTPPQASPFDSLNDGLDYDVLIVGAGLSGLCAVHHMRQLGLRTRVLEAGSGAGGTWFWNQYPGARVDSESYSYIFSFAPEILAEWDWTEHFAGQPETLRYVEFLVQRLGLRAHLQFDTRVTAMVFDEGGTNAWRVEDQRGLTYTARFVITATGVLNEPTIPAIPGLNDNDDNDDDDDNTFQGESWHTARWPAHATLDFLRGQRVGVVGTGATGVQTIQTLAPVVGHLTVFQRTPNWTAPLRNGLLSNDAMEQIRADYPAIFARCARSAIGAVHLCDDDDAADPDTDTLALDPDERTRRWESLFQQRGFSKTAGVARDVHTDRAANALYSAFHAAKIRARVRDPAVAALLIPRTHGFGTRRVPLETHYYEAYNQANVRLVDLAGTGNPIARAVAHGLQLADGTVHALDVLVFATGFDAVTGSFRAVDIRGRGGQRLLDDTWASGIQTLLGLTVHGFPNLFMLLGPHQPFGNAPRSIEFVAAWTARCIAWLAQHGHTVAEPTPAAAAAWTAHVHDCAQGLLANDVDSWMTGVNGNLAHKQTRSVMRYCGPAPQYRARCDAVHEGGYKELILH